MRRWRIGVHPWPCSRSKVTYYWSRSLSESWRWFILHKFLKGTRLRKFRRLMAAVELFRWNIFLWNSCHNLLIGQHVFLKHLFVSEFWCCHVHWWNELWLFWLRLLNTSFWLVFELLWASHTNDALSVGDKLTWITYEGRVWIIIVRMNARHAGGSIRFGFNWVLIRI